MATYTSVMRFIEPWSQNKELPFIRTNPEPGYNYMNFEWVDREVQINNSRDQKETYSIDEHGFAYTDDIEGATQEMLDVLRENDGERIREKYYPHIEHLVKKQTGASQVIIFDHTSRKRRPELGTYENPTGKEQPATMVHCDQSTKGALRRLEQNVPVEVHNNLQKRVLMINVWRPLRGPVQDWPLATMDYRTCNEDLIYPTDLLDKTDDYRGQTVTFSHAPEQTWYYLDQQETHEVTFIKIWDNKQDVEAKLCPHAAFKHPNAPVDAPPRESIEVRCFAIFD